MVLLDGLGDLETADGHSEGDRVERRTAEKVGEVGLPALERHRRDVVERDSVKTLDELEQHTGVADVQLVDDSVTRLPATGTVAHHPFAEGLDTLTDDPIGQQLRDLGGDLVHERNADFEPSGDVRPSRDLGGRLKFDPPVLEEAIEHDAVRPLPHTHVRICMHDYSPDSQGANPLGLARFCAPPVGGRWYYGITL